MIESAASPRCQLCVQERERQPISTLDVLSPLVLLLAASDCAVSHFDFFVVLRLMPAGSV